MTVQELSAYFALFLVVAGLVGKAYHNHMVLAEHTRMFSANANLQKEIEKANVAQDLVIQALIKREEAYEKFIHKQEYKQGMENLENKLLAEIKHSNEMLKTLVTLMEKSAKGSL